MFYGVLGGTGLMLAALTMLMAGQMLNSHLVTAGSQINNSANVDRMVAVRSRLPSARSTNP